MQAQQTESVATAVQMLCEQNLMPGVRSVALTAPNTFRTERLYTEEVDLLYKKHLVLLKAIYTAFRRAPNGGGLRLKVSLQLMLLVSVRCVTQVTSWSGHLMVVVLDSRSVCSSCVIGVSMLCDRGIALPCSGEFV
jgi:hypothetical protein